MDDLKKAREEIDAIDNELTKLFVQRMEAVSKVALYKKGHHLPIYDQAREQEILTSKLDGFHNAQLKDYYAEFLKNNMKVSKEYQSNLLDNVDLPNNIKVIDINTTPAYKVYIGHNILKDVNKVFNLERKVLILTDTGIPAEIFTKVKSLCKEGYVISIEQGEASKNIDYYTLIMKMLLKYNFSRKDAIVAVGGGVCGDLAGFIASTYMRGIDFYNIPTSLLAMVDSSIGGKTAIDFNGYKNVVGSFYQPCGVLIDLESLKSLDERQLHAGLVEAIKMAATFDKDAFELIENSNDIYKDIEKIVINSLKMKKMVVETDTKESGLRKVLNFGHTFGHAFESNSHLNLLHGEAVGIGMLYVSSDEVKNRLVKVLQKYNLPTSYEGNNDEIMELISHDKKSYEDFVDLVICEEIGSYKIKKVSLKNIKEILEGRLNIKDL